MCRSIKPERRGNSAGFTLIEVLIALAILAVSLTAIGSLVATNIRTTRTLDERLALVATTRAILASLPSREQLVPGNLSGELEGHRWRVDVRAAARGLVDSSRPALWVPQAVALTVVSPGGRTMQIDTVRLRREPAGGR